jgi:PAS domain S-box-containing protein
VEPSTSTPPRQASTPPAPAWAVIGIDHLGTITWWDDGAVAHLGHAHGDVLGRNVEVIVPPELRSAHRAGLAAVAAGGPRNVTEPFELPVLRADGTVVTFGARLNHLDSPQGRFAGAVVVLVPSTANSSDPSAVVSDGR